MNNIQVKHFTITDVINTAISRSFQNNKLKDSSSISMSILNEITYLNIWNNFIKWVQEQADNNYNMNIYPYGVIKFVNDKNNYGLNFKISDTYLNEFGLKWNSEKYNCEKETIGNQNMIKLNLLAIGANLNIPKIYLNNGLNNIFKSILYILSDNKKASIDIGYLGVFYCNNKEVFQIPSKSLSKISNNKKISIKTLLDKNSNFMDEYKKSSNVIKNINIDEEVVISNIENNKYFNKDDGKISKFVKPIKNVNKLITSTKKGEMILPFFSDSDRHWNITDMLDCTFKFKQNSKQSLAPIYFNVYSNTIAAPFTGEKTQIPICHRLGSFYTLTIQNMIIDKTTKSIKLLYDEYFYKHYGTDQDQTATEQEEYDYVIGKYKNEEKVKKRKEIYKQYIYSIKNIIKNEHISEIKESWLVNIVKLCLRTYRLNSKDKYDDLLNGCIKEILKDYIFSIKKSIIDYMLKHPDQREKLNIPISFRKLKEYSEAKVTRLSDNNLQWKTNWNSSKIKISSNLMIITDNVTKILKYYMQTIKNSQFLIIPNTYNTMSLSGFVEMQKNKLEEQRKLINEDWKKYVENVLKENKIYKDQLFIYFKSVSAIMSTELREIIIQSLKKFHAYISLYKKEQYPTPEYVFENQFKSSFPFEACFLEVSIIGQKNRFVFSEDVKEIHNKIINLVQDVVKSSRDVERPDNMFIKNLDKQANLWEVPINDHDVVKMINEIDYIVKDNIDEIQKVILLYDEFKFIGTERETIEMMIRESVEMDKIISDEKKSLGNDPNYLTREIIEEKISLYAVKLKILREKYPNTLYMNMVKIDCSIVNDFLIKELMICIEMLLKYIYRENISHKSKQLNEEIEKLKEKLNSIANTELELNRMEREFEEDKEKKIPSLYNEYSDFLEWVFFYWKYDIYPKGQDSSKIGSTDVVSNLENIIHECYDNVLGIQTFVSTFINNNLVEKKTTFENNLQKTRENIKEEIARIEKKWEEFKIRASDIINQEAKFEDLEMFKEDIKNSIAKLDKMHETENLLGTYNTDEPRLARIMNELNYLLKVLYFVSEMKSFQSANESIAVKNLDFVYLTGLSEKALEVPESLKECKYLKKNRVTAIINDIETFRNTIAIGKQIFNLIEIVKILDSVKDKENDYAKDDSYVIIEENKLYCAEFTRLAFKNERGQDYLKNIVYKQITFDENYHKNKPEIEKLISEWESVRTIFESLNQISLKCDVEFKTENFKNRLFKVVTHENYDEIFEMIDINEKKLSANISNVDNFRFQSATVDKMKKFLKNLNDLREIITFMKEQQIELENAMLRQDIYNQPNLYAKLKEVSKLNIRRKAIIKDLLKEYLRRKVLWKY